MTDVKDQVLDHMAKVVKEEAEGGTTIKFGVKLHNGKELTLSALDDFRNASIEIGRAMEDQKYFKMFDLILLPGEFDKLANAGATLADFEEVIMPAWQEASGLGEG